MASPIMHRFIGFFLLFVRGPDVLSNALNVSQFRCQVAPQDSQICGGNFQKRKKRPQSCDKYFVWSLLRQLLNPRNGRSCDNILPVCIVLRGTMLLFLVLFFCLSRSWSGAPCVRGVHSSNKLCAAVYCPISTPISAFFSEGIALSGALQSSHLRRQLAPQCSRNCGQKLRKSKKSVQKFVRTTSYRQLRVLKKFYYSSLGPGLQMCTYINFFPHVATQR